MNLGENIGAKLRADKAESDKKYLRKQKQRNVAPWRPLWSKRTSRKCKIWKLKLIEAQSSIPMAMAEAFRSGNWGSWTTHAMKISSLIPKCANLSQKKAAKQENKHFSQGYAPWTAAKGQWPSAHLYAVFEGVCDIICIIDEEVFLECLGLFRIEAKY